MSTVYIPLDLKKIKDEVEAKEGCSSTIAIKMIEEIVILREAIQEMDSVAEEDTKQSMAMGADAMKNAALEILEGCATVEQALKRVAKLNCEIRSIQDLTDEEVEFIKSKSAKYGKKNTNLH